MYQTARSYISEEGNPRFSTLADYFAWEAIHADLLGRYAIEINVVFKLSVQNLPP
jgi:hypothetical protein